MNIVRAEMLAALDAVKGAVAQKELNPILTHVLVEDLSVVGFDSEVGVKVKLTTPIGGTFNVKYDLFHNLIRSFDTETVEVTVEGKKVFVRGGRATATLFQIEEAYPKPSVDGTGNWLTIPAGFKEALERVLLVASDSEQERVLSSVMLKGRGVFGTNRKNAARCVLEGADFPALLMSRKAIEEIVRLGQPNRMLVQKAWSLWDYGNLIFLAVLREGLADYPPVDLLFSRMTGRNPKALPDGLQATLSRLSLFSSADKRTDIKKVGQHELLFVTENEQGGVEEIVDEPEGMPEGKGFPHETLSKILPYADGIDWGVSTTDPIYLKGAAAGFECVVAAMARGG